MHLYRSILFFLTVITSANKPVASAGPDQQLAILKKPSSALTRKRFPFQAFFNTTTIVLDAKYNSLCDGASNLDKCCSCKNTCMKYKDCCIDHLWYETNLTLQEYVPFFTDHVQVKNCDTLYTCEEVIDSRIQGIKASHSKRYFMIAACDSSDKSKDSTRCNGGSYDDVKDTIPVIGADGNLYRSPACARCNDILDYEMTNVSYHCENQSYATSFQSILSHCEILLSELENKLDTPSIVECFYTNPVCDDPNLRNLCHSYTAVTQDGHKNKDCARCEGKSDTSSLRLRGSPQCRVYGGDSAMIPSKFLDFSGRFDENIKEDGRNQFIENVEIMVFKIGLSISMVGYILLIVTYVLFKELQNIPGLNALLMFISALLGDSFLLVDYQGPSYCRYAGVLLHYLFLVGNNWVLVICFDFGWTFSSSTKLRKMSSSDKWKVVWRYTLFALSSPLILLIPIVILNELDVVHVGYSSSCWVSHFQTRLWSYIVPVGVLNLISICILFRALVKIYRIKTSSNKTLHSAEKSVKMEMFNIACKLVFGILFVEVIGFIQVPREKHQQIDVVLSFIYNVIRSLKGVFFCSLYLYNGKVFCLYRSLWARQKLRLRYPNY